MLEMEAEHHDGDDSDGDDDTAFSARFLFRTEAAADHFVEELNKSYQEIYQVALPVCGAGGDA